MPTLQILAIFCLLIGSALAQDGTSQPSLRESLQQPWKTLKFGIYIDQGDDENAGPHLLLQRLDSRVVLSVIEFHRAAEQRLPIALAVITNEAATKLVEAALSFYAEAEKETGRKPRVNSLPKLERDTIFITFDLLGPGINRSYSEDFRDGSDAMGRFRKFLDENAKSK